MDFKFKRLLCFRGTRDFDLQVSKQAWQGEQAYQDGLGERRLANVETDVLNGAEALLTGSKRRSRQLRWAAYGPNSRPPPAQSRGH